VHGVEKKGQDLQALEVIIISVKIFLLLYSLYTKYSENKGKYSLPAAFDRFAF
jgi:hypothetical protein